MRFACLLALALLFLALAPAGRGDAPAVFAIRDARIVPVSGPPLERGTIVLRDGLFEAVGVDSVVPADARLIDGKGLTVYPGLIDALSDLGLPGAATAAPTTGRGSGRRPPMSPGTPAGAPPVAAPAAPAEPPSNMNPFFRAADTLTDGGVRAAAARLAGITSVLVAPNRGIFAGQSALANLNGERARMVVRSPVALHLALPGGRGGGGGSRQYPGSLMGVLAYLRQGFLDARRYAEAWQVYSASPRGLARPETDRALEALQPVLRKEMPVVIPAASPPEIMRALQVAEESDLRLIVSGGAEAGRVAGALKERDVPVIVALRFPTRQTDVHPDAEDSLRELQRRLDAPKSAAALYQAGVKFAFTADGLANPRDFLANVRRAVRAGLPPEAALRALTLSASEIFGVQEQLGSLEKGKIANLIIADGDLFADQTRLRHIFVDGKLFDDSHRGTEDTERGGRGTEPPRPEGTRADEKK